MDSAIAFDIGGTSIKYALVDREGNILHRASAPSVDASEPLCDRIKRILRDLLAYAERHALTVRGIGAGVPSVVDGGKILFCNNLPELDNLQLDQLLAEFGLPVYIENDANVMGIGEVMYGAARGYSDVVFLTVGTGIGGALFLNGTLYGGYRNRGTELGHILIHGSDGKPCTCGARGCLEAHASVSALVATYRDLLTSRGKPLPERIDGAYIVERYKQTEEEACLALRDHLGNLALGVISLINVFAPQKVVIGGGISESGEFYIQTLREMVNEQVMKETSQFTQIEAAALGNQAGCLGAAALVFHHVKANGQ